MEQQTLAIIKPGFELDWAWIMRDIVQGGLEIVGMQIGTLKSEQVDEIYKDHLDKSHYSAHKEYMMSMDSVILILRGNNAVEKWRKMMGATDPQHAEPGTVRANYASDFSLPKNCVHGSDSTKNATREMQIFFPHEECIRREGFSGPDWGSNGFF